VVFILPDDTYTGKRTAVYPEPFIQLVHAIVKLNDVVDSTLPAGASAAVDVTMDAQRM
jgi:hypothetical protein